MLFGVLGRHPRRAARYGGPPWLSPAPRPAHPRRHRHRVRRLGHRVDRRTSPAASSTSTRAAGSRSSVRSLLTAAGYLSPDVDIDVRTLAAAEQHRSRSSSSSCSWRSCCSPSPTARHRGRRHLRSFLIALDRPRRAASSAPASVATSASSAPNNRRPLLLAAFVAAFLFPFTQDGSDANMSIATQS